jgi:hypothetical protein
LKQPEFLTLDEALVIHTDQIQRYGGTHGIRDIALLASVLAAPELATGVAEGRTGKAEAAVFIRRHTQLA